jgi:hypothetical protein
MGVIGAEGGERIGSGRAAGLVGLVLLAMVAALTVTVVSSARTGRPWRGDACQSSGVMTPYRRWAPPDEFIQGAALDLSQQRGGDQGLRHDLRTMRDRYHINTVNLYGLESWDPSGSDTKKDRLFAHLRRLGLKAVVRIERYDPNTFAFRDADAAAVLDSYRALLRYVSAPGRRDRVAYFAVNMPVDDSGVQSRLGGVNSALSTQRQPAYAQALITGLRGVLTANGFAAAKLLLGVFYGWDSGYAVPTYSGAQPDGYFLTNYSYPMSPIPDERASDSTLINQPLLRRPLDRLRAQYGAAPVVIEYGFHTVAFNRGVVPDQTAGLVLNAAAKKRALTATTSFYRANYPSVRGTLYFGYNLVKAEGAPANAIDFALDRSACGATGA